MIEEKNPFPPSQRSLSDAEVSSLNALEIVYNSMLDGLDGLVLVLNARPKFAQVHEIKGCPVISVGIDICFEPKNDIKDLHGIVDYLMGDSQPLPIVVLMPRTF